MAFICSLQEGHPASSEIFHSGNETIIRAPIGSDGEDRDYLLEVGFSPDSALSSRRPFLVAP